MKSWITILIAAAIFWTLTDVRAASTFAAVIAPLLLTVIIVIIICKVKASLLTRGRGYGDSSGGDFTGKFDRDSDGSDGSGD